MKNFLCIVLLCCLSLPLQAQRLFVGGGGGYTSFEDHFGKGYQAQGKAILVSDVGLALDLSSRYVVANGETDTDPDIKMIPIMAGFSHFLAPKARFSPYMGGSLGASIMSQDFDTPAFIYGWKIGALFHAGRDFAIYVEGETFYLEEAKLAIDIQPWFVSAGVLVKFGGKTPEREEKVISKQKRRRVYDRRQLDRKRYRKLDRERRRAY